ncbi:hypothetical protein VOLCADRAFT_91506 [Volvox carteri f. nagariensis]|uniref:Uncharacterized protein n=1 Tax=Volvox carteri f. nagariensis TaxID=3068 RepID=D8TX91_VOLCA|nr:uncharacterized protein VOLCADRAFT_91506 [Volvox carteri f. nagariensis]EFJ47870.1 hypothetical protein VOLCADRAFT_91506 [Volvox carteri f. nagariensis]|eukprot:XP_002950976.1 hypothetical protein VOLCADRAFT_91506 [Volvox carteri f. nagariensis]
MCFQILFDFLRFGLEFELVCRWHSTLRSKTCRRSSLLFCYVQLIRDCPDDVAARRAAYDKAMQMVYGNGGSGGGAAAPLPQPPLLGPGGGCGTGTGSAGASPRVAPYHRSSVPGNSAIPLPAGPAPLRVSCNGINGLSLEHGWSYNIRIPGCPSFRDLVPFPNNKNNNNNNSMSSTSTSTSTSTSKYRYKRHTYFISSNSNSSMTGRISKIPSYLVVQPYRRCRRSCCQPFTPFTNTPGVIPSIQMPNWGWANPLDGAVGGESDGECGGCGGGGGAAAANDVAAAFDSDTAFATWSTGLASVSLAGMSGEPLDLTMYDIALLPCAAAAARQSNATTQTATANIISAAMVEACDADNSAAAAAAAPPPPSCSSQPQLHSCGHQLQPQPPQLQPPRHREAEEGGYFSLEAPSRAPRLPPSSPSLLPASPRASSTPAGSLMFLRSEGAAAAAAAALTAPRSGAAAANGTAVSTAGAPGATTAAAGLSSLLLKGLSGGIVREVSEPLPSGGGGGAGGGDGGGGSGIFALHSCDVVGPMGLSHHQQQQQQLSQLQPQPRPTSVPATAAAAVSALLRVGQHQQQTLTQQQQQQQLMPPPPRPHSSPAQPVQLQSQLQLQLLQQRDSRDSLDEILERFDPASTASNALAELPTIQAEDRPTGHFGDRPTGHSQYRPTTGGEGEDKMSGPDPTFVYPVGPRACAHP